MTFYQVVNEIRKKNSGEFLYLNPYYCDDKDKYVLFCDKSKLCNLPSGFEIVDSKLVDNTNNREYEIRTLDILKNIESNSEYRLFPVFVSETKVPDSIKNIIDEIKRLNVEVVDGVSKEITLLYYDEINTFVCNKELSSLKLPDGYVKLEKAFKVANKYYGFTYCNPLKIINYSSYIYPNVSSKKVINSFNEFCELAKLLNPNCKMGLDNDKLCSTIQINDLVLPDCYFVDDSNSSIYYKEGVEEQHVCYVYKVSKQEFSDKVDSGEIKQINANVFAEANKAKKHKVYELDAAGNFIYENGKRKTREGTLQESIDSLKKARSATKESKEKSEIMADAFFNGRRLAEANNIREYERIKNVIINKMNSYPIGDVNRTKYELALSEFEKGYKFNETKKIIDNRKKHIIVKKEYKGINQNNILIGASMLIGAGMIAFKHENPTALFEYVETEKFKAVKEKKPGFIARGCKKLLSKVKDFVDYINLEEEEVDFNAYAR